PRYLSSPSPLGGEGGVRGTDSGTLEVAYPDYPHEEARPAMAYVRPHELEIRPAPNGEPSFRAKVLHANPAGASAKIQVLAEDSGRVLSVEVSQEQFAELAIKAGDTVFVSPRRVRVFVEDYAI